jgi:hypothetical protein
MWQRPRRQHKVAQLLDLRGEPPEPEDAKVPVRLARVRRARVSLRLAVQRGLAPAVPAPPSPSLSSAFSIFVFVFFFFFFLLLLLLLFFFFLLLLRSDTTLARCTLGPPTDRFLTVSTKSKRLFLVLVGMRNARPFARHVCRWG